MKKLNLIVSLICIWLCSSQSMSAQCFITTVDGMKGVYKGFEKK